jgi:hypothetical protein
MGKRLASGQRQRVVDVGQRLLGGPGTLEPVGGLAALSLPAQHGGPVPLG